MSARMYLRWLCPGHPLPPANSHAGLYGYQVARNVINRRVDGGKVPRDLLVAAAVHLIGRGT